MRERCEIESEYHASKPMLSHTFLASLMLFFCCYQEILCFLSSNDYYSFQPVLHDWCNKDRVCAILYVGMVHIYKKKLAANKKRVAYAATVGFLSRLSEWSDAI